MNRCAGGGGDVTRRRHDDDHRAPAIVTERSRFIQLAPMDRVSVLVGSSAVVIPRTTVQIHCRADNHQRTLHTGIFAVTSGAARGKGEAFPLWVDVQKLFNMCNIYIYLSASLPV